MSYKTNEEREIDEEINSELEMNNPENDYNEADETCQFCDGTGEGQVPDSLCYHCKGRG
jgi:DnaJ-class molecular chaperone